MAVTVEKLKVDLAFDSTNLRRGFAESIKDVKAFELSIGGLSQKIKELAKEQVSLENLRKGFDYVKESVLKAAEAGSALADMHDRTGIAVESLEHLKFAADQTGASIEKLEIAVKKMQKEISHFSTEEKFNKIGLSLNSLRKLKPDEQLIAIGDAISKLKHPTERAAAAQEIFGKSGTDLLPMFKDGKNGIAALIAESKRLGGVWTTESVEAADHFGDNLDKLRTKSERFQISIGNFFIPVLNDLSDAYLDLAGTANKAAKAISDAGRRPFIRQEVLDKEKEADARRAFQKQAGDRFFDQLDKAADTRLKGLQDFFVNEKPNVFRDFADAFGVGDVFRQGKAAIADRPKFPKKPPDELVNAFGDLREALGLGPGPLRKLAQQTGVFEGLLNGLGTGFAKPITDALAPLTNIPDKLGLDKLFGDQAPVEVKPPGKGSANEDLKALQFGSAEALSAIAKAQNESRNADRIADKHFKEAKTQTGVQQGILDGIKNLAGIAVAKL